MKLEEVLRWQEGENSELRTDTSFVDKKKKEIFSSDYVKIKRYSKGKFKSVSRATVVDLAADS
eukprot:10178626-Ditylum_brightwellii.AAC.1